jgi:hypothetical protein
MHFVIEVNPSTTQKFLWMIFQNLTWTEVCISLVAHNS